MPEANNGMNGHTRWLPLVTLVISVSSLIFSAGLALGSRDSDTTNRLDAQASRMSGFETRLAALEKLTYDNASGLSILLNKLEGYIENRAIVMQQSIDDRKQLNLRVTALEETKSTLAVIENRLVSMENLLRGIDKDISPEFPPTRRAH